MVTRQIIEDLLTLIVTNHKEISSPSGKLTQTLTLGTMNLVVIKNCHVMDLMS